MAPLKVVDVDKGWHFERRINLDTIIGLLGIAAVFGGPMVLWGRAIEASVIQTQARVLTLETVNDQRSKFDVERDSGNRERQREMAAKIDKFDDKLSVA